MLEVRKATPAEMGKSDSMGSGHTAQDDASPNDMYDVVKAATSPARLHTALDRANKRRDSSQRMSRYRVQNDCDEDGKKFISIDVLPHFL